LQRQDRIHGHALRVGTLALLAEAARHESKRAAAAERLAALGPQGNPTDVAEQSRQTVTLMCDLTPLAFRAHKTAGRPASSNDRRGEGR
jgi:hypothetical protein